MDDEEKKALDKSKTRTFSCSSKNVEALDMERSMQNVEKLLRELGVTAIWLAGGSVELTYCVTDKDSDEWSSATGKTLAEAYNKLKTGVRE